MHTNVPMNDFEHSLREEAELRQSIALDALVDTIALEIEEDGKYSEELLEFFQEAPANWTKDKIINECAYKLAKEQMERVR